MDIKTTEALCVKKQISDAHTDRLSWGEAIREADKNAGSSQIFWTPQLVIADVSLVCFPNLEWASLLRGLLCWTRFPPREHSEENHRWRVHSRVVTRVNQNAFVWFFLNSEFALNLLIRSYSKFPNPPLFNHSLAVKHAIVIIDKTHIQVTQPFICIQLSSPSRFW